MVYRASLTPAQQNAAEALRLIEPGFQPHELFKQLARLMPISTIELMPFRINEAGRLQILLTVRDPEDPFWGGQWHSPGSIIRPTDQDPNNKEAFDRILKGELAGIVASPPRFLYNEFRQVERGPEQVQVWWSLVEDDTHVGQFFDVNQLPDNTIYHHKQMVAKATPMVANQLSGHRQ